LQLPFEHPTVLQLVHFIAVTPVLPHEGQGLDFCHTVIWDHSLSVESNSLM
jgi:hypothetical protein